MLKQLKELYKLLTREQQRKLLKLQILVVLMAFAEVAGVMAIGPFMGLVGDVDRLQGGGWVAQIYLSSGSENPQSFLVWLGVAVLGVMAVAALISTIAVWRLSIYGARVGTDIGARLYHYYMYKDWLFHAAGSSSQLTNQIAQESQRVSSAIIGPLMQVNAKLVLVVVMALAIIIVNPVVAILGVTIFSLAYFVLYVLVRKHLSQNGKAVSQAQHQRFKLMDEGFGGIKDVLLLGRQDLFVQCFNATSESLAEGIGLTRALAQVPRFFMELIAFGSIILLIIYLLVIYGGNLGSVLSLLSIYALAGFKMLPAFQQVYSSLSMIKGNIAAFDSIRNDLEASQATGLFKQSVNKSGLTSIDMLIPQKSIKLIDVFFTYTKNHEAVLRNLNVEIPVNQTVAFVGPSGSGKSTAIDLILGLIAPQQGQLLVDDVPIADNNRRAWQNNIGFVSQSIFLADSSIKENVAFGLPGELIDEELVWRALRMAHLVDLVKELPEQLETRVGERGVQLSGGQRQRIGIARALYHDAKVLVLDEATSALDGITEKLVMEAIQDFSGTKTIILIAHRLATVKQCDCIYFLENGRVVDSGLYDELFKSSSKFREMASHA